VVERPHRAGFKLARKLLLAPEKRERPGPDVDVVDDVGAEENEAGPLLAPAVGVPERLLLAEPAPNEAAAQKEIHYELQIVAY
jgi:hypothetical protein